MRYFRLVLFSIALFILALFAYYNQGNVFLVFLKYKNATYETIELPLFAFFYIAILITVVVMSLLGAYERTALRLKAKKLEKENQKLKVDLEAVRAAEIEPQQAVGQAGAGSPKEVEDEKRGLFGRKKKRRETTKERPDKK